MNTDSNFTDDIQGQVDNTGASAAADAPQQTPHETEDVQTQYRQQPEPGHLVCAEPVTGIGELRIRAYGDVPDEDCDGNHPLYDVEFEHFFQMRNEPIRLQEMTFEGYNEFRMFVKALNRALERAEESRRLKLDS